MLNNNDSIHVRVKLLLRLPCAHPQVHPQISHRKEDRPGLLPDMHVKETERVTGTTSTSTKRRNRAPRL